jgi:hypothetical protein
MHIALANFKGQLGEDELQNARMPDTIRAWLIVKKFYCTPLTNRSGCSGECDTCILNVKKRIGEMDFSSAKAPYALFTWSLKHVVQNVVEATVAEQKAVGPVVGDEETDVLDLLMETLSE